MMVLDPDPRVELLPDDALQRTTSCSATCCAVEPWFRCTRGVPDRHGQLVVRPLYLCSYHAQRWASRHRAILPKAPPVIIGPGRGYRTTWPRSEKP